MGRGGVGVVCDGGGLFQICFPSILKKVSSKRKAFVHRGMYGKFPKISNTLFHTLLA